MFKAVLLLLLIIAGNLLGNDQTSKGNFFSPTVTYGDSSGMVAHHVNIITGDFIDYGCDLNLPGPCPLTLERYYATSVFSHGISDIHGWYLNNCSCGYIDEEIYSKSRYCTLYLVNQQGNLNHFEDKIPKKSLSFQKSINPEICNEGYTNTSSGYISGQTNLINTKFKHHFQSDTFQIIDGSGLTRHYVYDKKIISYLLTQTVHPNGHKTIIGDYKRHKIHNLPSFGPGIMKSTNEDGSKTYGSITCSYGDLIKSS